MKIPGCYMLISFVMLFFNCETKHDKSRIINVQETIDITSEINYLRDKISKYPDNLDYYIKIAELYDEAETPEGVFMALEEADKRFPDNTEVQNQLAKAYVRHKDLEKASVFLKILEKKDEIKDYKVYADFYRLKNDYRRALDYASKALSENPFDWKSHMIKGDAYLHMKDTISAINSYKSAHEIYDGKPVFRRLFSLYLKRKSFDEAKQLLRSYVNQLSSGKEICYEEGKLFLSMKQLDSAKVVFKDCIQSDPENGQLYLSLGELYFNEYKYDSSLFMIEKTIRLDKKNEDAYVLKARIMDKRGMYNEAKGIYENILQIDTTAIIARQELQKLERKIAYLRDLKRKEAIQSQMDSIKPAKRLELN